MAQLSLAFDILARDKASRTLSDVGDSADRAGGKVKGFASNLGAVAKGLIGIAAVKGAFDIGKGLYDAAIESQKVTKQTEAVIKSMGGVAGVSAKQVAKLSEALSMKTGIDDELIQSGQNVLLTFGNIRNEAGKGPKTFDRATKAALDMSVALGTDLDAAAIQVGKALNDPIDGLTKLERSGIQFTDQQKEQIRTMQEAGDMAGAQAIMLAELERQFGGSAEAQATAGDRLRVVWGNLQETIGEKLVPVVEKFSTWLVDSLPAAMATAQAAFDTAKPYIQGFADAVGAIGVAGLEAISNWWETNGETVIGAFTAMKDVIVDDVVPAFQSFIDWIKENEHVLEGLRVAVGVGLVTAFGAYAASAVAAATATVVAFAPWVGMIALVAALTAATNWLVNKFNVELSGAIQWVVDRFAGFLDVVDKLVAAFKQAKEWADRVVAAAGKIPGLGWVGDGGGGRLPFLGPLDPTAGVPLVPFLDDGGVMPGRRGVHYPALVAGGETVLPTHKGSFTMGPDLGSLEWANEAQLVELREQNRLLRALVDQRSTRAPRGVAV